MRAGGFPADTPQKVRDVISARFPLPVLILDDGELLDIRAILSEMDVEYVAESPDSREPSPILESGLVIAASDHSRRAADLCAATPGRILIEILQCESPAPDPVSKARCDFIVRRPVHTAALRLLIQRALYAGPERRKRERVAIGSAVTLRAGMRTWVSTLLELSHRSCRLLSSKSISQDRNVTVRLPRRLTGGETLRLKGRVVRSEAPGGERIEPGRERVEPGRERVEPGRDSIEPGRDGIGSFEIAVSFDSLAPANRRALRVVLEGHLTGPASLATDGMGDGPAYPQRMGAGTGKVGSARMIDRRSEPRQTDSGLPPTARVNPGTLAAVLIGRDLSPAGMRVERDAGLALGDALDLLLHGGVQETPIAVKATVERIDEGGCFLRFGNVGAAEAARIEELVDALVVTERPRTAAAGASRVVISEVLHRSAG